MARLLFLVALVASIDLIFFAKDVPPVRQGPIMTLTSSAISFWREGRFNTPLFESVKEELEKRTKEKQVIYAQDVFAVTAKGTLAPKHCAVLIPLAAIFYGLFGLWGFTVLNGLFLIFIAISLYRLTKSIVKGEPFLTIVTILMLGTQTLFILYELSYDLFGACLIICGLDMARKKPLGGAFLMAFSLFVRPFNIVYMPFLIYIALLMAENKDRKYTLLSLFSGFALGCGIFGMYNHLLWGSPFVTVYDRTPNFAKGEMVFKPAISLFSIKVFLSDWWAKLFGLKSGLLLYNPALLALPFIAFRGFWNFCKVEKSLFFGGLMPALLLFGYKYWGSTGFGNRFLLPSIYLWCVLIVSWAYKKGYLRATR
ncbi:MAG: hypothetical protein D6808_03005 [Candidatus Dadabacteria bacterium]|nr:MAG: hypothetical protein D6808_03005 [Candidatus Dadabacteria bacterium]